MLIMKSNIIKYFYSLNGSISKVDEYYNKMNEVFEKDYSLMSFCIIKEKWYAIFIKNNLKNKV